MKNPHIGSSLDSLFAELGELEEVKRMTEEKIAKLAPITYVPGFVDDADIAFARLRDELEWERRDDTPRSEYYCNDIPKSYVYGRGRGEREYHPKPYHEVILAIRHKIEAITNCKFEVCFLNRYHDQSDHLGWHADDSPEMDDARPIAIVSLGVEREIWFKPQDVSCTVCRAKSGEAHKMSCFDYNRDDKDRRSAVVDKLTLGHGSLCLMAAGMQDNWFHRIPKASFKCGERISLTFRGYVGEITT